MTAACSRPWEASCLARSAVASSSTVSAGGRAGAPLVRTVSLFRFCIPFWESVIGNATERKICPGSGTRSPWTGGISWIDATPLRVAPASWCLRAGQLQTISAS